MMILIATLFLGGCLSSCGAGRQDPDGLAAVRETATREGPSQGKEAPTPPKECAEGEGKAVKVFADKDFYRERKEPEETLRGVLRLARVRIGPNTRDMPFKLELDKEILNVYVTDREEGLLKPLAGRKVKLVGKRVDLRSEGHGIEVWIATITAHGG